MGFNNNDALSAITNTKGNVQLAIKNIANGCCSSGDSDEKISLLQKAVGIIKLLCVEEPSGLDTVLQHIQQNDPLLKEMNSEHEDKFKEIRMPLNEKDIQIFEKYQQNNEEESNSHSHSQYDSSIYLQQIELTQKK